MGSKGGQRRKDWGGTKGRETRKDKGLAAFSHLYLSHYSPFLLIFPFQFPASVSFSTTYSLFYSSVFLLSASLYLVPLSSLSAGFLSFFISVQSLCNCRSQQEIFSLWEEAAGRISGNIPFYCC